MERNYNGMHFFNHDAYTELAERIKTSGLPDAAEDLEALKSVVQVMEDQKDWPYEREMLRVVLRALDPIIADIQECIDNIGEELKGE